MPSMKFMSFGAVLLSMLAITALVSGAQAQRKGRPASRKPVAARTVPPAGPVVKRLDLVSLRTVLEPRGKPLLINFWATWCEPCREEFPDLVQINSEYAGRIDFVTISLDDLAEINRDVPKFLAEMKAEMPAYLLRTTNETAAINAVNTDWNGALPFTILYDEKGATAYTRQGRVVLADLRARLNGLLAPAAVDNK
jgi:thiol-disulfide isomerase/thioredoxin